MTSWLLHKLRPVVLIIQVLDGCSSIFLWDQLSLYVDLKKTKESQGELCWLFAQRFEACADHVITTPTT